MDKLQTNSKEKYFVDIYVAAPGTPLVGKGFAPGDASLTGHMYYAIRNNEEQKSFGLAPAEHGKPNGPGKVYDNDVSTYQNPYYSRTLEITKTHYEKLKEFGQAPEKFGFDKSYKDARNNCIDFTWGALKHSGLQANINLPFGLSVPTPSYYEGQLKPINNIDSIKTIHAPMPDSKHNKEVTNPLPKRDLLQRLFSENDQQPNISKPENQGAAQLTASSHTRPPGGYPIPSMADLNDPTKPLRIYNQEDGTSVLTKFNSDGHAISQTRFDANGNDVTPKIAQNSPQLNQSQDQPRGPKLTPSFG
jgi:hypothetical protein